MLCVLVVGKKETRTILEDETKTRQNRHALARGDTQAMVSFWDTGSHIERLFEPGFRDERRYVLGIEIQRKLKKKMK